MDGNDKFNDDESRERVGWPESGPQTSERGLPRVEFPRGHAGSGPALRSLRRRREDEGRGRR